MSNLVSDYIKLTEEVQVLNKLKQSHPHSDDLISEIIAVRIVTEVIISYYLYRSNIPVSIIRYRVKKKFSKGKLSK